MPTDYFAEHRLLLLYKGDISALLMFAEQANGSVCFPEALPALSSALEPEEFKPRKVNLHPSVLLQQFNRLLNLDDDLLRLVPGFNEQIDTPGCIITVYMARFTVLDPPKHLMQARDCHMRTLPELRGRPPAEMELLRRAYVTVMGG